MLKQYLGFTFNEENKFSASKKEIKKFGKILTENENILIDILSKSLVYFKTIYKIKTSTLINICHDDNKVLIDRIFDDVLLLIREVLNSSKVYSKFTLIEYFDYKINDLKTNGEVNTNKDVIKKSFINSYFSWFLYYYFIL